MTTAASTTLGRLGAWAADHRRLIVVAWGAAVLVLGALAPFADRALSGAGWEAPGSESGKARRAIESHFPGQGTYALSVVGRPCAKASQSRSGCMGCFDPSAHASDRTTGRTRPHRAFA